jgi:microcystin-dependent protein
MGVTASKAIPYPEPTDQAKLGADQMKAMAERIDVLMSAQAANDPVGAIMAWPSATPPSGYLACDGAAVSRTTYAALFAVIGTTFGGGDGSTTFALPDLRGRTPLGVGTATGAAGATAHTLGQKSGEETHALTIAELASHTHTGTTGNENAYHQHDPPVAAGYREPSYSYRSIATTNDPFWSNADANNRTSNQTAFHQHGFTTAGTGSGTAHNTLPPYVGLHFVIKAVAMGLIPDTGWFTPTLVNSWVNYGSGYAGPRYRRVGGITYLQGLVMNGTGTIFTLPAGFRTTGGTLIFGVQTAAITSGRVDVDTAGNVLLNSGSNGFVSLSNIQFPADA